MTKSTLARRLTTTTIRVLLELAGFGVFAWTLLGVGGATWGLVACGCGAFLSISQGLMERRLLWLRERNKQLEDERTVLLSALHLAGGEIEIKHVDME